MIIFEFTNDGWKYYVKLPKNVQERITKKLISLKTHPNIFTVVSSLENVKPATHKLRVGDYRLVLEFKSITKTKTHFMILDTGHRKDIYRRW